MELGEDSNTLCVHYPSTSIFDKACMHTGLYQSRVWSFHSQFCRTTLLKEGLTPDTVDRIQTLTVLL